MSALAPTLQAFFTDRLVRQRNASPNTIAAYRDTLKLLLAFASKRLGREPSQLDIGELDATVIAAFLDHLEHDRGNSISTRNARLAAIHSLFRYAAHHHPEHAQDIQRVLAIPIKRSNRAVVTFLEPDQINALIEAPDRATWTGRRDHALLVTAIQTGLRATELTGLNIADVHLGTGPHVNCRGERTQRADHAADEDHGCVATGLDR
jgi:site-specific recombinase XerD